MQRFTTCFKRLICLMLGALVLASPLTAYADYDADHPEILMDDDISASAYILIEQSTGNVILERNPDPNRKQTMFPSQKHGLKQVLDRIRNPDRSLIRTVRPWFPEHLPLHQRNPFLRKPLIHTACCPVQGFA